MQTLGAILAGLGLLILIVLAALVVAGSGGRHGGYITVVVPVLGLPGGALLVVGMILGRGRREE